MRSRVPPNRAARRIGARGCVLVLSCEHASFAIPDSFREAFRGRARELRSHRGWDRGALEVAEQLASCTKAPLVAGGFSRLLADLNRSPHHPRVLSELTRSLPSDRQTAARVLHQQHWDAVRSVVASSPRGLVVHLAVHSFTPQLHGVRRNAELGLLYDPQRAQEVELALELQRDFRTRPSTTGPIRVRRNYPYRGVADGLPTALRKRFPASRYAGLEVELNEAWIARDGADRIGKRLALALIELGISR